MRSEPIHGEFILFHRRDAHTHVNSPASRCKDSFRGNEKTRLYRNCFAVFCPRIRFLPALVPATFSSPFSYFGHADTPFHVRVYYMNGIRRRDVTWLCTYFTFDGVALESRISRLHRPTCDYFSSARSNFALHPFNPGVLLRMYTPNEKYFTTSMDTYTFVNRGTEKVVFFIHIVYFWKQIQNNEIVGLIGL